MKPPPFNFVYRKEMRRGILPTIAIALTMAIVTPARSETIAPVSAPVRSDLKQVLTRLHRPYRDTNSFSAKFNEEITTVGAPKRQRTGTVSFRKPGRIRCRVAPPKRPPLASTPHP